MAIELYSRVALTEDFPEDGLRRGDVATVVERLTAPGIEDGYALEIFNAVGETVGVVAVPESAIRPLTAEEILSVRTLA